MNAIVRRSIGCLLTAGVLALSCIAGVARAAEPLVWKFKVGETNRYEMTQKMTLDMSVGGGAKIKSTVEQTLEFSWVVESIKDDGAAVLKQRIDRMKMAITGNDGQQVVIDSTSDKPAEGQAALLAPLLKELTSSAFTVTMTPRGEIVAVEVPESLVKTLQGIPGAAQMGDLATAEGFKKMVKQASFAIPEKLEPGVEWTSKIETKNPVIGGQTISTTYKYEGPKEVDGKTLEAFSAVLEISYDAGGGATKIEIIGQESNGEILFNREAGRLESSNIDQGMDLKFSVNGQEATQALDQNVATKWIPEEAKEEK
jgi:hypothetical protein